MREAATAPGFFLKQNQMMLFETIVNRLHVLFCLVFFLLGGGGTLKSRNGGFGIEECFLYLEGLCLIKRVRPSPPVLRKPFYENEEFMFSKLSKMKIFRFFH